MVKDLIFKKPEEEGLNSKYILKLLDYIKENKINLHSLMIVRNGNILTEGYYKPFDENFCHRIYSSSKTFVAIAIGMLIDQGKVKLNDKISDYFPELITDKTDKLILDTTIEDALKMAVPMLTDTYYARNYKDWAWTFFNTLPGIKPSGTIFNYNTSGTFILDVLVEKITGRAYLDFMRPLFDKLGISNNIKCVKSPDGYSWGGSGVICTMRDFAKFGEFILNKGLVNGEQLVSKDFMEKATTSQISNLVENSFSPIKNSGYGYQIWITPEGYCLRGMGCETVFCFPKKNFMFVCMGDTQADFEISAVLLYEKVKELLYDNLDKEIFSNDDSFSTLQNELKILKVNSSFGEKYSSYMQNINNVKYTLNKNDMGWKFFKFNFEKDKGVLTYENKRGVKSIKFGLNEIVQGNFPENHYYDMQVDVPAGRQFNCYSFASWLEEKKIIVCNYIIDNSFGNCFMTFSFKDDRVALYFTKNAEFFMDDYLGYAYGEKDN